jgi:sensor histidine kinase YesM
MKFGSVPFSFVVMDTRRTSPFSPGIIISILLALILSLRRLLRVGDLEAESLTHLLLITFSYTFSSWICSDFILKTKLFLNSKWLGIFLAIIISIFLSCIHEYIFKQLAHSDDFLNIRNFWPIGAIVRGIVIGGLQCFLIYYINVVRTVQQAKTEIELLKRENVEAKLSSLKSQLSPHFLFNSLNTLRAMTTEENARNYIVQLSKVYRYLLNYNEQNLVTLKDELDFARSYLFIMKERFEDALNIEIDIHDAFESKKIPPLALQILLENAIKHNIASQEDPLLIRIGTLNGSYLYVQNRLNVKNSLQVDKSGNGLRNIRDRYALLSQKQIEILHEGRFFTVKLPLIDESSDN